MRKINLLRLLVLSCFLSLALQPHQAAAQWPTLDISSVKEGISTNIELVKQSKVVTDAMATAGKINSAIGDAKASVSKFVGDNLKKAQEKLQKLQEEKERIEKRKEQYEKIKNEIDEKKAKLEEYKSKAEELNAQAKGYIDDAKGYVNDAKEMKEAASGLIDEAKSEIEQRTGSGSSSATTPELDTTQTVANPETQTVTSGRTAFGTPQALTETSLQALEPTSDNKNYGETEAQAEALAEAETSPEMTEEQKRLQAEMDSLDQEKAELEVDAMFAKTPEEKAAIEEKMKALDEKYKELEKQQAESKEKAEESKDEEAKDEEAKDDKADSEDASKEEQQSHRPKILDGETSTQMEIPESHRPKILDGETSTQMEIPESHRPKILDTYEAPKDHRPKILDLYEQQRSQTSGGFRKRATPKTSALEGKHYASRSFSEKMVFADLTGGDVPDGTVNGVFIFSNRLAQECEVNVKDLEDETVMDECIKKLVKDKSDADASIAQGANAVYKTIMQETGNALIAESMARKNEAANYETEVLEKMEEKIADTKTTRDDTSGLSMTNMETQKQLNSILSIYSSQVSMDALGAVGGFDKSYYQDADEESGEE